ncbi:SRPBCC family protein [Leptospira semungkisensis]|uniref:SRPBCC family protein n=1 Tax=Leptospira semungkisensis TaxID=2484985 RepID=A0A4V3JBX8_9LEPT|nr:SRPBCC family protein [Leptospira semungkisensis]TGK03859.1 SRPBCC family protein [Leptospira semungkisensis]
MSTYPVRHISIHLSVDLQTAYDYLADPRNFPEWASGLCKSIQPLENGEWLIDSPMGELKAVFTEKNQYGVLDHTVIFGPDKKVNNPMRILANDQGSELVFTLFQLPEMSDKKFEEDAAWVKKDLTELSELLKKKFSK